MAVTFETGEKTSLHVPVDRENNILIGTPDLTGFRVERIGVYFCGKLIHISRDDRVPIQIRSFRDLPPNDLALKSPVSEVLLYRYSTKIWTLDDETLSRNPSVVSNFCSKLVKYAYYKVKSDSKPFECETH